MARTTSIKGVAKRAKSADAKARKESGQAKITLDSFQNFAANMGLGTDNVTSGSSYGFNPITRIRTLLEWIHRGSWIGGVAVDVVADDMTRAGFEMIGKIDPEDSARLLEVWRSYSLDKRINSIAKWGRLYGGGLGVILIDGQDASTPLRMETIGKDSFRGVLVLDRWMVEPSIENLVTELGPELGMPKFYRVTADAPALRRMTIHHSRTFRMEGVELPYWQRVQENLWSISVYERLYDRMIAFDSATTGAAQLVYKAHLRLLKIKGYKQIAGSGGKPLQGLQRYVDMMRRFQTSEGMTVIDSEDEFEALVHGGFAGLSDALTQFGQQMSGALQIPLTRLFGQAPAGLGATDEAGMRNYYDGIKQKQENELRLPITKVLRIIAKSEGMELPEGFGIEFKSLWQMTTDQKATVAQTMSSAVRDQEESGIIDRATALKELKYIGTLTGLFTNITDDQITEAEQEGPPVAEDIEVAQIKKEGAEAAAAAKPDAPSGEQPDKVDAPPKPKVKDRKLRVQDVAPITNMKHYHDLDVIIETAKGELRSGGHGAGAWQVVMPYDYGYVRRAPGADGDMLDVCIGPNHLSKNVYVVDQRDLDKGGFDEHKVMLGYDSPEQAMNAYCAGYHDGRGSERVMHMLGLTMDEFKQALATQDLGTPAAAWEIGGSMPLGV